MTIGSTGSGEVSLARAMARSALAVDLGGFDADVIAKAKLCLLDFLSCAFEARNHPWSRQAIGIAREVGRRRNHHRHPHPRLAGRRGLRQRRDGARPGPRGHARGQHLPPRRGDLADAARAVGADAVIRRDAARRRHHRLRDRRADRPRAVQRRPRPPLPADRPGRAARRGAGGKLCARPFRRRRDQRHRDRRQYIVRPQRVAARRRLRDVFPSRLCGPQRDRRDRTGRGRRARFGNDSRRRGRPVRRLPPPACARPTSGCSPARAGDHGRLQQAGARLQFRADRRAGRAPRRARARDIGGDRTRLDPCPRGRGPLSRLRLQGALSQRAAGQDEHSLQRRRRAGARRDRRRELCRPRRSRHPPPRRTDRPAKRRRLHRRLPGQAGRRGPVGLRNGKTIRQRLDDVIAATPEEIRARFRQAASGVIGDRARGSGRADRQLRTLRTAASSPRSAGSNRQSNDCGQHHDR